VSESPLDVGCGELVGKDGLVLLAEVAAWLNGEIYGVRTGVGDGVVVCCGTAVCCGVEVAVESPLFELFAASVTVGGGEIVMLLMVIDVICAIHAAPL
jgi:hypothetical protein